MKRFKDYKEECKKECKTVFVFGAGIEMGKDIGLCSADDLPTSLIQFINKKENEKVIAKLKEKTGRTDSLNTILKRRIDGLFKDNKKLSERIKKVVEKYPENDFAHLFKFLSDGISRLNKLGAEEKEEKIEERLKRIRKKAGIGKDVFEGGVTPLIDVEKLSFTADWTKVIENVLDNYWNGGKELTGEDRECLAEFTKGVADFDSLLTKSYIGFYSGNQTDINRYFYLSWLLWLYLADIDTRVDVKDTIYNKFVNDCVDDKTFVITMNYSTFIDRAFSGDEERFLHFHGDLSHYVDYRTEKEIPNYDGETDLCEILDCFIKDKKDREVSEIVPIPSMMPPLEIKPLISNSYLDRWIKAKRKIDEADRIFVVGYSFSQKDDHFNELIYEANGKDKKEIYIISPKLEDQNTVEEKIKGYGAQEILNCTAEYFFGEGEEQ